MWSALAAALWWSGPLFIRAADPSLARSAAFATSVRPGCTWTVVGAGPGGVYFAWRLAEALPALAPEICIFDQAGRVGGRILTLRRRGPRADLTVEPGAYRYVKRPVLEPETKNISVWTVLTTALVEQALRLPSAPYEPGDPEHAMWKIVDSAGHNAGYVTFVEELMRRARAKGVRFFRRMELTAVEAASATHEAAEGGGMSLTFLAHTRTDPEVVFTQHLLLNLPQLPLLRLVQASPFLWPQAPPSVDGQTCLDPLYVPSTTTNMKLYVHYTDAWWRNVLNLTTGEFRNTDSQDLQQAPIAGRYHDGDVRCDPQCRGYLEAFYTPYMAEKELGIRYYQSFSLNIGAPYTVLDNSTSDGRAFLAKVHASLVRLHAPQLAAAGALERVRAQGPTEAVLAVWDAKVEHYGCATHTMKPGSIPPAEVPARSLAPFQGREVYVANEAFSSVQGWAEGSLVMAENLAHRLGLARPEWIDPKLYQDRVLFAPAAWGPLPALAAAGCRGPSQLQERLLI